MCLWDYIIACFSLSFLYQSDPIVGKHFSSVLPTFLFMPSKYKTSLFHSRSWYSVTLTRTHFPLPFFELVISTMLYCVTQRLFAFQFSLFIITFISVRLGLVKSYFSVSCFVLCSNLRVFCGEVMLKFCVKFRFFCCNLIFLLFIVSYMRFNKWNLKIPGFHALFLLKQNTAQTVSQNSVNNFLGEEGKGLVVVLCVYTWWL